MDDSLRASRHVAKATSRGSIRAATCMQAPPRSVSRKPLPSPALRRRAICGVAPHSNTRPVLAVRRALHLAHRRVGMLGSDFRDKLLGTASLSSRLGLQHVAEGPEAGAARGLGALLV